MNNNKKLYAADVLEHLLDNGQITIAGLSEYFEVSPETIRNRLRELKEDGEAIIHNKNGIMLVNRELIESDEEVADSFRIFVDWVFKSIKGVIICAKPTQPLLPALKRSLRESLSNDERRNLSNACLRIKMLTDSVEIEDM